MRLAPTFLLTLLLAGCAPHTSREFPGGIDGQVVDAASGVPVSGAVVRVSSLENRDVVPQIVTTGSDGRFKTGPLTWTKLEPVDCFAVACEPPPKPWFEVSAAGYRSRAVGLEDVQPVRLFRLPRP
jgi:hypothetical protein